MTDQEINYSIGLESRALFFKDHGDDCGEVLSFVSSNGATLRYANNKSLFQNYAGSLDAMRRAELSQWHDEEFIEAYEEALREVYRKAVGDTGAGHWWMAPARFRAEAFLRARGVWKQT